MVKAIGQTLAAGTQTAIHCGDLIGVNTLCASLKFGFTMHAVHGNNIGDQMALHNMMAKTGA